MKKMKTWQQLKLNRPFVLASPEKWLKRYWLRIAHFGKSQWKTNRALLKLFWTFLSVKMDEYLNICKEHLRKAKSEVIQPHHAPSWSHMVFGRLKSILILLNHFPSDFELREKVFSVSPSPSLISHTRRLWAGFRPKMMISLKSYFLRLKRFALTTLYCAFYFIMHIYVHFIVRHSRVELSVCCCGCCCKFSCDWMALLQYYGLFVRGCRENNTTNNPLLLCSCNTSIHIQTILVCRSLARSFSSDVHIVISWYRYKSSYTFIL